MKYLDTKENNPARIEGGKKMTLFFNILQLAFSDDKESQEREGINRLYTKGNIIPSEEELHFISKKLVIVFGGDEHISKDSGKSYFEVGKKNKNYKKEEYSKRYEKT